MSAVSDHPRVDRSGSEPAGAAEGTHGAPYSDPAGGDAPTGGDGRGRRGRRRRGTYLVAAGALTVALGGTAAAFVAGRGEERTPARKASPVATVTITRGDLVDTEAVDGTLTYDDERSVNTRANGVITWLPAEGAEIERGEPLLKVANKPMTLMYGSLPLYRALRQGVSDGRDVQQLERNLKALGYGDDLTVDKEFTPATAAAVKAWQDDAGLPENGAVDASQVVFQPAAVRVSDVPATVGGQAGGQSPLKVTGTKRLVQVDLDADKQDLVKKGATVTIELPDGEQVKGKISKVGKVAESGGNGDNPDEEDTPTIDVEVSLSGEGTGNLDKAPVTVNMESERSEDVLSVPVEALLALREGGFGVEVVEGGATRIVAVETGAYGGGRVEITGSGLREGMKVGVPSS